jgi:ribulose-phosphate 3-epimerase
VHYEACPHLHRTVDAIKKAGMKAGVALNPHTPVSLLEDIIKEVDMILIMSVNPGFGGQKFIEHTYQKVSTLRALIKAYSSEAIIEVDGGVNLENAPKLVASGVNALVAGSTVYKSENPLKTIEALGNA